MVYAPSGSQPARTARADRWSVPVAWLIGTVVYGVLIYGDIAEGDAALWVTNLAWTGSAFIAALGCFQASRVLQGYQQRAWSLFAVALALWLIGQLIWDWHELVRGLEVPFPSLADVFFTAFGCVSVAALYSLREPSSLRPLTPRNLGNLGLIVCTLAVAIVTALFEPIAQTQHSVAYVAIGLTEALSISLAFVVSVYFLWSHRWGLETAPLILVVLSYAMHGAAALLYLHALIQSGFSASHPLNILWIIAMALMHLASRGQIRIATGVTSLAADDLSVRERSIEALLPGLLLLVLVIAAVAFNDYLTTRVLATDAALLVLFAIIMLVRESWIYARERNLKSRLDQSYAELERAKLQLDATLAELQDTEQVLRLTASAGNVGLFEVDLQTRKARFSHQWKRQLGYTADDIRDDEQEWRSRLHPDDLERAEAWTQEITRSANPELQLESRLRHRDGRYRWMLTQATVRFDDTGKPLTLIGSQVDITHLKDTEAALRESEARYRELAAQLENRVAARTMQLRDAYSELESFAYAVSHDLKAPLRAIDGFSHLLVESAHGKLDGTEREYLTRVRHGALRMAALIDGLLAYSRVERRELQRRDVNLREMLDDIVNETTQATRLRPVTIRCDVPDLTLQVDKEALLIVLRNLIDNAVKFTRNVPEPRIEISAQIGPDVAVLKIRDNGIGFEQIYHDQIFSIFQRLHADGEYEGTGIGLALARKAVQRMNGRLWAESAPGAGATFYVELPLRGGVDEATG
jgi:PAS domain S-box-containing protein